MITVTLEYKGIEFDVMATAEHIEVVEYRQGMDEFPGVYVVGVEYYDPDTAKPVSKRLARWIVQNHGEYVKDMLAETA